MSKKHRAESEADVTPAPATPAEQSQEKETEEVKEVTKALFGMGCYEVSLGDTTGTGSPRRVVEMLEDVLGGGSVPVRRLAVRRPLLCFQ